MPYTASAILIAALIVSLTLRRGFHHMAKTVTDAAADITAAVSAIAVTVATDLQLIADSISEHIANGTAVDAIEAQVGKLNALNEQLQAGAVPVAPVVEPVAEPVADAPVEVAPDAPAE